MIARLLAFFRRARLDQDLDDELSSHLQLAIEENLRSGMSPAEARRIALLKLGGLEQTRESVRDQRGLPWFETVVQDLRYGARMLRKYPSFTAVSVLTLALGIGANSAIFSLVNGILLVSLPYPKADQLVSVTGAYPQGALVAMRKQVHTMDVAAYAEGHEFNLTGHGETALRLTGTVVSAELFSILGAHPELGRTFVSGEDIPGQDASVILSHALWQQRFASDPSVIGRSIELEGATRQVIGVMPADFRFPSTKTEIWLPLHNDPRSVYTYWAGDYMPVIGRLRPGSTLQQARTEIRMFQSHAGELFPWHMPAAWNADVSVLALQNGLVADVRVRLLLLLAAVALVLLIACTNVANLTLSRAATREKEVALRSALGAGRKRILRQLLTESVLLASLGALLGLVFAFEGLSLLKGLLPADTPRLLDVHMDWRVLAFTAGLAILTGLVVGFAPALHISRGALTSSLKSSGRGSAASVSQRLRGGLVVGEIALAVLLVIAAGLMIRSFWALSHVNPGFRSEHILTARITPNESFCSDAARCVAFYRNVLDQVRAFPGVSGAAVVNTLPLGGRVAKRSLNLEDHVDPSGAVAPLFWLNVVTPGYFRVMGIPLLSGREFTDADVSGTAVAVITAETARRYWPNQSPLGKGIRLLDDKDWRTIVGVISDVRAYDLQRNAPNWIDGAAYVPYNPAATLEDRRIPSEMTIAIRASSDDSQTATMLRETVASLGHEVPVSEVKTMDAVVSDAVSTPASTTALFIAFAALAMLLGIIGIYGVLSFLVSQRTRELGVRIALGARPGDILILVMKEGAKFSFAGIAVGLTAAILVTRIMASELYGVSAVDPVTYLAVALVMAAVTLLACYIPTRRAMRVDPITALRYE
ncbi:MAG: ABC transporter permease [Candidatus Acidiferrum sp.]